MKTRKALAIVYLVLAASGLSLLALGSTVREANWTHGIEMVQGYCPTDATPIRFINGACNLFLQPSFPGFWLPVLKASSDIMWNESWIRFLGKMWMSEFWMKQSFWSPFVWSSVEGFLSKLHCWCVCAWSRNPFILSLACGLDFPAWPQISLVTMDMISVLDTYLITILCSALLFLLSFSGTTFVREGTALPVLLSQLPVLLPIWRITKLDSA